MRPSTAKTVAAVSFHDNRSISMDVDSVSEIAVGKPMKIDEGQWFCELIIHSDNGKVALQLLADDPSRFQVSIAPDDEEEDGDPLLATAP